jgi:hypothetical protein
LLAGVAPAGRALDAVIVCCPPSSTVRVVMVRNRLMAGQYLLATAIEILLPGGSSMKGLNLSGRPGTVQPRRKAPTFARPPMPLVQSRLRGLHGKGYRVTVAAEVHLDPRHVDQGVLGRASVIWSGC